MAESKESVLKYAGLYHTGQELLEMARPHGLKRLSDEGIQAAGQVGHPDAFTAVQNALQFYAPDDIVISTFPETRSGWMRSDLIGRVQSSSGKPVDHVVSEARRSEREGLVAGTPALAVLAVVGAIAIVLAAILIDMALAAIF